MQICAQVSHRLRDWCGAKDFRMFVVYARTYRSGDVLFVELHGFVYLFAQHCEVRCLLVVDLV